MAKIEFEEIGIEERKLLLKAFDYDVDEENNILDKAGNTMHSSENPSVPLKVENVALTPGSLNVIDGSPSGISKFIREQENE